MQMKGYWSSFEENMTIVSGVQRRRLAAAVPAEEAQVCLQGERPEGAREASERGGVVN
jgi:hypothetical protein